MSRRDSDSRRHRSKFDREPSPKRSRRYDKESEISEQKHPRRLQDALPLEAPLKSDAPKKDSDEKASGHQGLAKDANEVPRSRSYHQQHDDRNDAGKAVQSSDRGSNSEHGRRRDSRDHHDDNAVSKTTNGSRLRNDKPIGDEHRRWRHDRYTELEADESAARKRPAFREMKAPADSEDTKKIAVETAKSSHVGRLMDGDRKKEERSNTRRHLDRSDKQFRGDRVRYNGEAQRDVFPSRDRYTNGAAGRNYRGKDRFGERQEYHSGAGRVEKWGHDLYHEANRSPTKTEEDQIAKVESLLAS